MHTVCELNELGALKFDCRLRSVAKTSIDEQADEPSYDDVRQKVAF